jgi:hypothetical protein
MTEKLFIFVDDKYYRDQFDDYLAGGKVEYKGNVYHWFAQDSNYGFGWEIEPVTEEDWRVITEEEFNDIIKFVEKCLNKHKIEYTV